MKQRHIFIRAALSVLLSVGLMSCMENYLDKTPDEDMSLEDVFSERNNAERFLNNIYSSLPNELMMARHSWMGWEANLNPFISASDEMENSWSTPYSQFINSGAWSPADEGTWTSEFWRWNYEALRKVNTFLEHVEEVPTTEATITRWTGEAYFLRAFFHFCLFRVYGPIIIMDGSLAVDEESYAGYVRQPIDKVIQFILDDCERARTRLDMHPYQEGRISAAAAYALESRLTLYAASPLFNGNPDYANFKDANGNNLFPVNEDKNLWKKAVAASSKAIAELDAAGYGLYKVKDNLAENYQYIFLDRTSTNKEIIMVRHGEWDNFEQMANSVGMGGWSGLNPTQMLVDAYEMQATGKIPVTGYNEDGSPIIDAASGYVEEGYVAKKDPNGYFPAGIRNMYVGRDPRFYASINFNGQFWKTRNLELHKSGKDGAQGGPDFPSTGYLLKKYSDPSVDLLQGKNVKKHWVYFRMAEMYLNYAEAKNEVDGPVDSVYLCVNAIRDRAGMPALPDNLTKEEMREKIRHERRIELAFETHRYFDCHRWKIAYKTESGPVWGLNYHVGTSIRDDAFYERVLVETRVFDPKKHYLWPIQQREINKCPWIIQNPGWDSGN